jgi:hypothetical protein
MFLEGLNLGFCEESSLDLPLDHNMLDDAGSETFPYLGKGFLNFLLPVYIEEN